MRHLSALLKRLMRRAVPFQTREFSPHISAEIGKRTARSAVWIRGRLFAFFDEFGGAIEQ